MIRIETDRLIIRNYSKADIEDFYEYMQLEYTSRYEDFGPMSHEECVAAVTRRIHMENALVVELKSENKVIGDINFSADDDECSDRTYVMGYDFNFRYQKKGYATEACTALIDFIFNELHGRRIYAECNDDNFNSIKLLERLGFRREGYFMEDIAFKKDEDGNPIYINSYLYAILKREWNGSEN
ncbi:MAG: ribosomal-protein-S5-alanine N-acetyltransferase [Eubacterium sp.]|jgi:RimJ/RimL family protein N-acetyltransferase|nr:ribosomal-protein-S5-alanine N-acetyltransferase [Eubacterium sp.]